MLISFILLTRAAPALERRGGRRTKHRGTRKKTEVGGERIRFSYLKGRKASQPSRGTTLPCTKGQAAARKAAIKKKASDNGVTVAWGRKKVTKLYTGKNVGIHPLHHGRRGGSLIVCYGGEEDGQS